MLSTLLASQSHLNFDNNRLPLRVLSYNKYENDDNYDDDDNNLRYRPRRGPMPNNAFTNLFQNQRKLGATLLGIGLILTFMGVMLFFEGNLLRFGNILTIIGAFLLLGPGQVQSFFMQPSRLQGTIIIALGILLVFFGKPRLGILLEMFGVLNLFGNMFPYVLSLARQIPIFKDIIGVFEGNSNDQTRRKPRRKNYDPDF